MQHMTIHPFVAGQVTNSTISTVQLSDVHVVQSTMQKGTQEPKGKKKKGKDKIRGGNNNKNPKSDANVGGAKKEKKKVKFPCKLCSEALYVVLKNSFPHGKNLQVGSSEGNMKGGTQNEPLSNGSMSFINMVNHKKEEEIDFSTRTHN